MTKVELQEKCFELLHKSHLRMLAAVPRAIEAGAVDYEAEPAESYWLAKAVIAAVLAEEALHWGSDQSYMPNFLRLVNNIRRML